MTPSSPAVPGTVKADKVHAQAYVTWVSERFQAAMTNFQPMARADLADQVQPGLEALCEIAASFQRGPALRVNKVGAVREKVAMFTVELEELRHLALARLAPWPNPHDRQAGTSAAAIQEGLDKFTAARSVDEALRHLVLAIDAAQRFLAASFFARDDDDASTY